MRLYDLPDVLPAVIDLEGVDPLRVCDQLERTIHRLRGGPVPRTDGARWLRLCEGHDRFAAHAGIEVG